MAGFEAAVGALERNVDLAGRLAATRAGLLVQRTAQDLLSKTYGPRQNRESNGRFASGFRTSSPPGQPPALQTGTLRRSVRPTAPHKIGFGAWEVRVGPTVVYGRIQELGGQAGRGRSVTLPARPYMKPALEKAWPDLAAIYAGAWREATTKHF